MNPSTSPFLCRSAAILAVGDELALGQKLDTNSKTIAQRLVDRGIVPVEHATVDDDTQRIAQALLRLADAADVVVVTGGLGPTPDDLTRDALAQALGEPVILDERSLQRITAYFERSARTMPPANRVQALRPRSALHIDNDVGTAPGIAAVLPGSRRRVPVFCLPGPPREMVPMLESAVLPALRATEPTVTLVLHTFGIGESDLAHRLGDLLARDRWPIVGTTASGGVVSCRIRASDHVQARDTAQVIRSLLGPLVFAQGEEHTVESQLLQELEGRQRTLSAAESCTAGLLAASITGIAGASAVFAGGIVAYSNQAKHTLLHVPRDILQQHGAVSGEVALAMAQGCRATLRTDYALSITGIAGPSGGSENKPVGTVWIALADPAGAEARCFLFTGDRESIRRFSARTATGWLLLRLRDAVPGRLLRQILPPMLAHDPSIA